MPSPAEQLVPLCVDLDGTLVKTDMLMETAVRLVASRPWLALALPFWLARGRAQLKREIASRVAFDPALLPYDETLLADLRRQRETGRALVLATAADATIAERIAGHLGVFDRTLASDGTRNLKGEAKAEVLVAAYGERGFDYVGNDRFDVPVWKRARTAVDVGKRPTPWLRAIRAHQWAKNLLVFVPMLTAHRLDGAAAQLALIAFFAFSAASSAIYLVNDLADLDADRRHPLKRARPLAAGDMSIASAVMLAPLLLLVSAALCLLLPPAFAALLAGYVATTLAYSLWLKRLALVDVFVLAALYLARIFAGAIAVGVPVSQWLLGFSLFVFLSLALAKRFSEVAALPEGGAAAGRGYVAGDRQLLGMLGVAAGSISTVVFALYVTSREVTALYAHPGVLWLIVPLLLYWIARVWLAAFREQLREDPLLFTLRDIPSWLVVGAILLVMAAAR
jgi:4-hydroxybenzoate polyprenyltransferase